MTEIPELPNPQRRAIEIVREVAEETGIRPFLVGGPVRDLLLGRPSIDIDLTIEEDSSTLARALAKRLDAKIRSFPQFMTYKVIAADLPEIDIATARKERYREPGALPSVSPGKLKDDLLRRDFSINAIAFEVGNGTLHDPARGEEDLRRAVVRVLHDASFSDDPTRIYRAIRLAIRLGFSIEEHTAALMSAAITGGALSTVSRERIWRELFVAMDEDCAPEILAAFSAHGALDILFGRREAHRDRLEAAAAEAGADPSLDRPVLFTAAILHGDASPLELEGSGFSMKRSRNVMQIANETARFCDGLAESRSERQRIRLLRKASPELLRLLGAMGPDRRADVARFHEYRAFTIPVRGSDIDAPPGPHVARALERAREAVFTGQIEAEDAQGFAQQMAIKYLRRDSTARSK